VAALDLLIVQSSSVRGSRIVVHLLERPSEIDRRRTRSCELCSGLVDVFPTLGRKRKCIRSRDADCRRATDRELSNRSYDLGDRPALQLDLFVREPPLVEKDDPRAVLLVPNDVARI
jgi:hypothetical protein